MRVSHFRVVVCTALLLGLLAGCISSKQDVYGQIDPTEKTITVPTGNDALVGELKSRLRAAGWKMFVDRGPGKITGTVGETTQLETYDTFKTRYRLIVDETILDLCMLGGYVIRYDLSLIDNSTGQEVLAQSGRDCTGPAANKFLSALGVK